MHVCVVLSVFPPLLVIVMVPLARASLAVKLIADDEVTLLIVSEVAGVMEVREGVSVSMIISLLVDKFVAGVKFVIGLPDVSLIVPVIDVVVRSLEVSPLCTI